MNSGKYAFCAPAALIRASISRLHPLPERVPVRPDDHGAAHRAVVGQLGLGDHVLVPAGEVLRLRGEHSRHAVRGYGPSSRHPTGLRITTHASGLDPGEALVSWASAPEFGELLGKGSALVVTGSSGGRTQRQIHRIGAEHVLGVAVREDRLDSAAACA